MAFNANSYVKDSAKPFTNRLTDNIVNGATYGLPSNTKQIAQSISQAMVNAGSTYLHAADVAMSQSINVVDQSGDEFFFAAGKDPSRAARVSLQMLRRQRLTTTDYINNVLPATKIGQFKQNNTLEIIAVV